MTTRLIAIASALSIWLLAADARAQESTFRSAVDSSGTGAYVLLATDKKRGRLQLHLSRDGSAWGFVTTISGPLDEDSRIASLVGSRGPVGLEASVLIEHSWVERAWHEHIDSARSNRDRPTVLPILRLGLLSLELDRNEIFEGDLSSDAEATSFIEGTVGAELDLYIGRWIRIRGRGGLGLEKKPGVEAVERCTAINASGPDTSGRVCKQVLFADKIDRSAHIAESAQFEITLLAPEDADRVASREQLGVSLVASLEDRDNDKRDGLITLGLVGFVTPTTGKLGARFGIGVEHAVQRESTKSNTTSFFLFFGGLSWPAKR